MTGERQAETAQQGRPAEAHPTRSAGVRTAPSRAARRVLIASSEPAILETLERLVRHHGPDLWPAGVEVRRAGDGVTCLQVAELWQPDLLLLAPRLDRMSGAEVLESWRRAHPGQRLPAVALSTAFGSDVPGEAGFDGVLPVPWDGPELLEVLSRALASG